MTNQLIPMTNQLIELQTINDQELLTATGGGLFADITNTVVSVVPGIGTANTFSGAIGGPTAGDLLEKAFA